jgi:hypothetical protein
MVLLFRLPLLLLELLLRRVLRHGNDHHDDGATFMPADAPPAAPAPPRPAPPSGRGPAAGPPPPTAAEAIARRVAREAAATPPPPPPAPAPDPEPQAAPPAARAARRAPRPRRPVAAAAPDLRAVSDNGHVETESTLVESFGAPGDVGSAITVDAPWDDYDGMAAAAVIARVRGSDEATKAVVRMYEQQHKQRATVLRATE